jgi:uncharacterized protein involved in exopolysaccharide biosynthesis
MLRCDKGQAKWAETLGRPGADEISKGAKTLGIWSGDRSLDACAQRLRGFGAAFRRGRWWLAAWCSVGMLAALAYAMTMPAQFVARVDIAIAPRAIANDGPEDVRHFHQMDLDSEQAATEQQVLKSEELLRPVFENLNLAKLPELTQGRDGFWSTLAHYVHYLSPDGASFTDRDRAFFAFADRVGCLRVGLSYVFEISYRSHDPKLAARVANAVAAEYLVDRIERERARQARIGGAYQKARWEALNRDWRVSRAAADAGAAPAEDLFYAAARVLGPAVAPLNKSYPKMGPTLAMGAGLGLLFGGIATLGFGAASPAAPSRRAREARRGKPRPGAADDQAWDAASADAVNTSSRIG